VETELQCVDEYIKCYFEGLSLGVNLPSTELQPADDCLLLAVNAFINLWKLTGEENYLLNAVYLLELGVTKSKPSFQARLMLIRIYRLLGKSLGHEVAHNSQFVIFRCTVCRFGALQSDANQTNST
jgi:N-terminal acetyltransferase B complex non-catalytic subunit